MNANTKNMKRIERTFASEKEATRFWNRRKVPAGFDPITNEIEYNKDGTYTVRKVFVKDERMAGGTQ